MWGHEMHVSVFEKVLKAVPEARWDVRFQTKRGEKYLRSVESFRVAESYNLRHDDSNMFFNATYEIPEGRLVLSAYHADFHCNGNEVPLLVGELEKIKEAGTRVWDKNGKRIHRVHAGARVRSGWEYNH